MNVICTAMFEVRTWKTWKRKNQKSSWCRCYIGWNVWSRYV